MVLALKKSSGLKYIEMGVLKLPPLLFCTVVVVLMSGVDSENLGEILDLSWPYGDDTIFWPGVRRFEYTKKHAGPGASGGWYSANEFCTGEHVGTHLDAPYHFNQNGQTVEQVPLSKLIVPGVLIDITQQVKQFGAAARLKQEHLKDWELKNGPIPQNSVLLVKFGWAKYYSNRSVYLGGNGEHDLNFPGISAEAAAWIVNTTKIVGVGVDTASADPGRYHAYEAHKSFADNQIYILENVNILNKLPIKGFTLLVMPMKLSGGTGAPVRVLALPEAELPRVAAFTASKAFNKVPLLGHLLVFVSIGATLLLKMLYVL